MRFWVIVLTICPLFSIGCSSEKSDYDAGISAYEREHYSVALSNFEARAEEGDPVAQFCLGVMYENRQVRLPKNEDFSWYRVNAINWYKRAAVQDYLPAQNNLGVLFMRQAEGARAQHVKFVQQEEGARARKDEKISDKNMKSAVQWFLKAGQQGKSHIAQYNIGTAFRHFSRFLSEDPGGPDPYRTALLWFTEAAAQDYHPAQYELGNMYYNNKRVGAELTETQRMEKAAEWYTKAADNGNAKARTELAVMYTEGQVVDQGITETERMEKAVTLFKEAADPRGSNYADAQFHLGNMYYNNKGVGAELTETQRMEKAAEWYTEATSQYHDAAANNLGGMYANGKGVFQSHERAGRLYFIAAQQGSPVAQYNIGFYFMKGTNENRTNRIPQDDEEAYYWYGLSLRYPTLLSKMAAAENVVDKTTRYREQVENRLDKEQRDEIQERVDSWNPKSYSNIGTGFYINKHHILTNAHVVVDYKGEILDEFRIPYRRVVVVLGAVDTDVDLALLYDERGNSDAARFRKNDVEMGEGIVSFGYPVSSGLSYRGNGTSGIVSGLLGTIRYDYFQNKSYFSENLFQITAPTQPGNSGGPVFDLAGNVVGVTHSTFSSFANPPLQNINFAIKFKVIKKFLEKNGIEIDPQIANVEDTVDMDTEDNRKKIFQRAKGFTVPVVCFKNKGREPVPVVRVHIRDLKD